MPEMLTLDSVPAHLPPLPEGGPARGGRSAGRLYVFVWGALALAALAYVGALMAKPNWLIEMFPAMSRMISQPQGNEGQRAAAIAEVERLRKDLTVARKEAGDLKQQVAEREAMVRSGQLRVAGLEKELQDARKAAAAPAASSSAMATASPSATDTAPVARGSGPGKPVEFEMVNADVKPTLPAPEATTKAVGADIDMPLPARRPLLPQAQAQPTPIAQIVRPTIAVPGVLAGTASADTANPIETGSVSAPQVVAKTKPEPVKAAAQAAPIAFGAPVVTKAASPAGVRLTAGPSLDALRLSWSLMTERNSAELSALEPRYVVGNTPSAPFILIAGPLRSGEDAKTLCANLLRKGIPCSVDTFTGNAL